MVIIPQQEQAMDTHETLTQALIDEFVGAAHGDFDRVKELLARHPELAGARAQWGESAIEAAAQTGRVDIAELLLAHGAPLDICTAAMLGRQDEVAAFLRADPGAAHATGAHGIPVLYFPVIRGHRAIAELLLAHGADVKAGAGGNTPLHGAAWFDQPALAEWLIAQGAEVNARDYEGQTPLGRALQSGHGAVADVLRRHGGG
jgi:ankyrin repeat protein